MASHSSFLEDIIDEIIPMQPLHPAMFDQFLAEGWRLLGHSIVRHNFAICRGDICRTIPLRLDLKKFRFTKSQRKLLQKHKDLNIQRGPIRITPEKNALFAAHTQRFRERQPATLAAFLGPEAGTRPVQGAEYNIYIDEQLVASSYIHQGSISLSGTYCFFDPEFSKFSLGTITMLREIEDAIQNGFQYYYHGYCYNVPSQFDYKRNFLALEQMDWNTLQWTPMERLPLRQWERLI